ncbi:hypothetical protein [Streptomyces sp. NBC_01591]|uniref:hypothetical protein n=1 Tax=Streptomyces sp. NBC_01591 TaxID=2975888 RepID=UPI002DDC6615|nr:hypothetical protein [Streptomyces sp. NBC_01591]
MLIGQQSSTATLDMSGTNGRYYTAGSLTHTSAGLSGGQELHAYPFDGDLPACGEEPLPTPTPTPTPTDTPTHTPGPKPTPTHTWPHKPDGPDKPGTWPHKPHPGGELPHTGARGGEWILGGIAAVLLAAGSAATLMARRARRRG